MSKHLPNLLTLARIVTVPFILMFMALDTVAGRVTAVSLFLVAAATDALDGMLARKYAWTSLTGKFLDPLADKLLVIGVGVALVELHRVPAWGIVVVVMREFFVTGLRLAALSEGLDLEVNTQGKWKTAVQMIALAMLVLHELTWFKQTLSTHAVGIGIFYASLVLTCWSGVTYALQFFRHARRTP